MAINFEIELNAMFLYIVRQDFSLSLHFVPLLPARSSLANGAEVFRFLAPHVFQASPSILDVSNIKVRTGIVLLRQLSPYSITFR
jgi:hypothetical protein